MTRFAPWGVALVAAVVAAAPARAQQPERPEGHEAMSDAQFAALGPTTPDGQRYSLIYVKFNKQFNELLKLHASPLVDRIIVRDAQLRQLLLRDQDANGRPIPRRGNLQVIGTGQRVGQQYVLVATRVLALESDLEHARRRHAALGARDGKGRAELSRYVQARVARFFQDAEADQDEGRELARLARRLDDEVREIELAGLPALPGGAEAHLEVGRRLKALELLAAVWEHPEVAADVRARAEQALTGELNAQRHLGRWLAYDKFKELVGFARQGDRWVPRDRADFLQACEGERRRLLQHEPLGVLPESLLRQSKEVVKGMNKDMVLGLVQGYPERVERTREQLGASAVVFELWVMPDGQRIHFVNGLVFQRIDPSPGDGPGGE
ncbi:MAG: hypothetical protein KF878_21470 [Planctomycetes bacterium]|nr:hypothetical protein [Planctomycetota bacterium]